MAAATRVDLHLRCRVKPGMREAFLAFLREATPFYESPGGITIRLLEDMSEDHRFVELVLYDDEATYLKDQERVAHDDTMKAYLTRWRELLAEPPVVEVYRLRA
ncbi:MAG: putative quinol monooxygenase [Phycisphaerae bacterium]